MRVSEEEREIERFVVPLMEFDVYVIVALDVDFLLWLAELEKNAWCALALISLRKRWEEN